MLNFMRAAPNTSEVIEGGGGRGVESTPPQDCRVQSLGEIGLI